MSMQMGAWMCWICKRRHHFYIYVCTSKKVWDFVFIGSSICVFVCVYNTRAQKTIDAKYRSHIGKVKESSIPIHDYLLLPTEVEISPILLIQNSTGFWIVLSVPKNGGEARSKHKLSHRRRVSACLHNIQNSSYFIIDCLHLQLEMNSYKYRRRRRRWKW